MNQTPLASIIIPAWNGKNYIEACLNSLLAQDYPNFEVIVVDNASSDGTPDLVAQHFPAVTLMRNPRNLGFASGVNVGLRTARGEVLILFNQDAVAGPGWLEALVTGLLATPDIGLAGCKIFNANSLTLQHAGGYLTTPQAHPRHFGFGEEDTGQYDQLADVDFVTGAALAIRRDVVETIGYFDESFFFYYEDVDYCYRARVVGFRVVYIPQATLEHYSNTSLGPGTVSHYANFHAGRLQFVIKNRGASYFVSEFQPAEAAWFQLALSPVERVGLRQAYQTLIFKMVRSDGLLLAVAPEGRVELLTVLRYLRQQILATYFDQAWQPLAIPPAVPDKPAERWWEVKERPFVSHVPVIGPLIARFRTLWNDVATKWFVRLILQQQNQVNHILAQRLELQERILYYQSQFFQDFDHDYTNLTTQLIEISRRLEQIELRLTALEQKKPLINDGGNEEPTSSDAASSSL